MKRHRVEREHVVIEGHAPDRGRRGGAGEPSWIRTSDLLIKSQLLYRLSYGPDQRDAG